MYRRGLLLTMTFILASASMAVWTTSPTSATSEGSSSPRALWESWEYPDVVAYALSVRNEADFGRLRGAQDRSAAHLRDIELREGKAGLQASPLRKAQEEFGLAVDELYGLAAETSEAEEGRRAWRACMQSAGLNYGSPLVLQEAIDEAGPGMDEQIIGAIAVNDRCHASTVHILNPALRRLYDTWYRKHEAVIAQYRSQLGV